MTTTGSHLTNKTFYSFTDMLLIKKTAKKIINSFASST